MMSMANVSEKEYKDTEEANRKREWREKVKARREKEKLRKRKYRTSLCTVDCPHTPLNPVHSNNFNNRTSKHRAIQRVRNALPETPEKRTATLAAYIDKSKSPTVKHLTELHLLTSPEERNELEIGTAVINDIKTAIDSTKRKRSKEALGSMNAIIGSVSGENIAKKKCQRRLADRLNLPVNRICAGKRIRTQILTSQSACWAYTCRKTRSDALPVETKRIAYNYWLSTGVSRPTGNKSDIKRERIAPNVYSKHMVHILEKTQTEVYLDFKRENPNIAIGQRSFEGCKPYYVRQVRQKDRQTCCCRYHVEIKSCFKACMDFRKKYVQDDLFPIFNDIGEISDVTLCATGDRYHDIACLKRMCTRCGIHKLQFHPDETDTSDKAENVKWEKFENVDVNMKGNKTVRKLLLVKKETKPALLFAHFSELLKTFPLHQHRASWQSDQFKTLLSGLPQNHCIAVHDFSENYRCCEIRELQSGYFQKTEVSVHVTILHRHAVLALDGVDGTEESPIIVTEHFYIISPDLTHDQYFVHEARQQVSDYLKSISCPVQTMHEFTDGCAAQYKSRHCFGDISDSCKDYGYSTFTRNFFETSHSKGKQYTVISW